MLRLGLGPQVGTNTPADSGGASVIWKVAVYGAGTASSNGEYVWDGVILFGGKPVYASGLNQIYWAEIGGVFKWVMYEDNIGDAYTSSDLISWSVENGDSPAPSSALSYAQDSEIQSITLAGAGTTSLNVSYSWDGIETAYGEPVYRNQDDTNKIIEFSDNFDPIEWIVRIDGDVVYYRNGLFNWTNTDVDGASPSPTTSNITYSA